MAGLPWRHKDVLPKDVNWNQTANSEKRNWSPLDGKVL